jgi:hypothetical protein
MRTIPQATGPLENALRVLLDRQIAPSRIPGYDAWVAMNLSAGSGSRAGLEAKLEHETKCAPARAGATIDELIARGLLDDHARLTPDGEHELSVTRQRVKQVTDQLTAGLSATDVATAVSVLDHARARAESILAT